MRSCPLSSTVTCTRVSRAGPRESTPATDPARRRMRRTAPSTDADQVCMTCSSSLVLVCPCLSRRSTNELWFSVLNCGEIEWLGLVVLCQLVHVQGKSHFDDLLSSFCRIVSFSHVPTTKTSARVTQLPHPQPTPFAKKHNRDGRKHTFVQGTPTASSGHESTLTSVLVGVDILKMDRFGVCVAGDVDQMNYQNLQQNAPGGQYAQHSPGSAPRGGPQPYGAPPGKQVRSATTALSSTNLWHIQEFLYSYTFL